MTPDMSDVLESFAQPVLLKNITVTTVNFEPTESIIASEIDAVIQVADAESIKVDNIDYSKEYIMIHSRVDMPINDFIEWRGVDYKIKYRKNYADYGYIESHAEEVK